MVLTRITLTIFIVILILNFFLVEKTFISVNPKIGRGVFSKCFILPGQIIERSPTLEITEADSILYKYLFTDKKYSYVGFGNASLFNHSDNPNVAWNFDKYDNIVFQAKKIILPGQELLINYGDKYWKDRKDKINI